MEEEFDLNKLKQEYDKLKERYNLPEFSDVNRVFDIEEIDIDTDFLLRRIRRTVSERISGYLRFLEVILNPSNAPMFIFKLIKKISEEDKKQLSDIYEVLGGFELEAVKLDLNYNELKEADFIRKTYTLLSNDVSKRLLIIIEKMSNNDEEKKERSSYFG
ncbi:MAG: hypothetical protein WCX73_01555 [Candidatus Pacearchaeota archaeon]|jgi:hypothetical protein